MRLVGQKYPSAFGLVIGQKETVYSRLMPMVHQMLGRVSVQRVVVQKAGRLRVGSNQKSVQMSARKSIED